MQQQLKSENTKKCNIKSSTVTLHSYYRNIVFDSRESFTSAVPGLNPRSSILIKNSKNSKVMIQKLDLNPIPGFIFYLFLV